MGQGDELQGPPVPQALIFQAWLTDFGDFAQLLTQDPQVISAQT